MHQFAPINFIALTNLASFNIFTDCTIAVMIYFKAAQPALLYLVPGCLGSSFLCALVRGEVKDMLAYTEEVEEDDEKAETTEKESDKKND